AAGSGLPRGRPGWAVCGRNGHPRGGLLSSRTIRRRTEFPCGPARPSGCPEKPVRFFACHVAISATLGAKNALRAERPVGEEHAADDQDDGRTDQDLGTPLRRAVLHPAHLVLAVEELL